MGLLVVRETAEEAPATASVWLRQRRRWIKGWIVTALVHLRRPRVFTYRSLQHCHGALAIADL